MSTPGRTPAVLIVEESPELQKTLRAALEIQADEVEVADGIETALATLQRRPVGLVILSAPEYGTAADTLGQVEESFPGTPVVLISGHGPLEPEIARREWSSHDSRFRVLVRPIKLGELLAVSRELMDAGNSAVGDSV